MAFRKILSKRLFNDAHRSSAKSNSPMTSSRAAISLLRDNLNSPESTEKGFFRRFFHRRALDQSSSAKLPEFLSLPIGDRIRETLRGNFNNNNAGGDRLRLDFLIPPAAEIGGSEQGLSASDARKILRLAQMEKLKSRLREISESSISYSEFTRICVEGCNNEEQGLEFAKMLDHSGNVIVLGNIVFLRPDQVAKSIESIISQSINHNNINDPRRKEWEEMEKQKAEIDQKARQLVKGELYCGLGFVLAQTLAAMRLTFWELNWDVMEPICFFVTSIHFALGYGFFLKTSTEPTFQGYFQRRFASKQKRLMELNNFDVQKYTQLRKAYCHSHQHRQDGDLLCALNHG